MKGIYSAIADILSYEMIAVSILLLAALILFISTGCYDEDGDKDEQGTSDYDC